MLLRDKVVFISGVGPGLGMQLALLAAREGARIVLGEIESSHMDAAVRALDGLGMDTPFLALQNDIRQRTQCRSAMDETLLRFGRLDALINSAYVAGAWEPVECARIESWQRTMDTNLIGTLTLTQEAITAMKPTGGAIVMVNTMVVRDRPMAGNAEYDASKAALRSVTGNVAQEVGHYGIRVNSVFMGWMWGPSVERHLNARAAETGLSLSQLRSEVERGIPLGRMPTDEECARAVLFLASDYAIAITGACLDVNGGQYIPR